jgi:hypothetical protein
MKEREPILWNDKPNTALQQAVEASRIPGTNKIDNHKLYCAIVADGQRRQAQLAAEAETKRLEELRAIVQPMLDAERSLEEIDVFLRAEKADLVERYKRDGKEKYPWLRAINRTR